jgi:hypothetical protein
MALRFKVKVTKDGARATGQWDVSVDFSDADLIADFTLTVEGKNLNTRCAGGNK